MENAHHTFPQVSSSDSFFCPTDGPEAKDTD